ncbi:MBL fold metallo-hydrolase [Aquipuribacter nitratireducens]|uniref:beta-lactamase n=1 Tax=Aquipuribacter nitratireducens TaxID=650104 RepID=A0ABW0GKB2_9MICO
MSGAVEVGQGVWRLPTARFDLVNSYAFAEPDGSVTLVDAGYATSVPALTAGLAAMRKAPQDVRRLLLTHAHADHAGGAAGWAAQGAQVHAHTADAGVLETGRSPGSDRRYRLARWLERWTQATYDPVRVDVELHDGEVLDVAGGLRVVHTPGHTPGHVSLLHEPSGVLITGDVLVHVAGRLAGLSPVVCHDYPLSLRTVHALTDLDYTVAAFTHGPEIRDRARERVRARVRRQERRLHRHERRAAREAAA